MSDREQDKRVAEILGWKLRDTRHGVWIFRSDEEGVTEEYLLPRYTTDPAADYEVLEWMREKYEDKGKYVWLSFCDRTAFDGYDYVPGLFSFAVLAMDDQGIVFP